jgi:hypothetical protein
LGIWPELAAARQRRHDDSLSGGPARPSAALREERKRGTDGQSFNGRQGTELADLIVHKITEAVNAIAFK